MFPGFFPISTWSLTFKSHPRNDIHISFPRMLFLIVWTQVLSSSSLWPCKARPEEGLLAKTNNMKSEILGQEDIMFCFLPLQQKPSRSSDISWDRKDCDLWSNKWSELSYPISWTPSILPCTSPTRGGVRRSILVNNQSNKLIISSHYESLQTLGDDHSQVWIFIFPSNSSCFLLVDTALKNFPLRGFIQKATFFQVKNEL